MEASQELFDKFSVDSEDRSVRPARTAAAHAASLRPWCGNRQYDEIVGVDFGKGRMWCYCLWSGKTIGPVPYKRAIRCLIEDTPDNSGIFAESAHVGNSRTVSSLAQLFTEDELTGLYDGLERRGKTLRLFPQSATRRIGRWVEMNAPPGFVDSGKTTDLNDAKIIAYYVGHRNDISLMLPVKSFEFSDKSRYGRLVRRLSDCVLGPARSLGYKIEGIFPVTLRLADDLYTACRHTVPLLGDGLSIAIGVMSSVISEVPVAYAGGLESPAHMLVYKGRAPGYRLWKRYVMMMSPWHHGAGIFRSNLMYHRYPSILRSMLGVDGGKRLVFAGFDDDQNAKRLEASKALRHDLKSLYTTAVSIAGDSGLPKREVLEVVA